MANSVKKVDFYLFIVLLLTSLNSTILDMLDDLLFKGMSNYGAICCCKFLKCVHFTLVGLQYLLDILIIGPSN